MVDESTGPFPLGTKTTEAGSVACVCLGGPDSETLKMAMKGTRFFVGEIAVRFFFCFG